MPWRAGPKREANNPRIYLTTGRLLRVNKSYLICLNTHWIILEHGFGSGAAGSLATLFGTEHIVSWRAFSYQLLVWLMRETAAVYLYDFI